MSNIVLRRLLVSLPVLLLTLLLMFVTNGCEPAAPISVENRTDQTLTVWINDYEIGEVATGETVANESISVVLSKYLIEAKDKSGNLVFSREVPGLEVRSGGVLIVIEAPKG